LPQTTALKFLVEVTTQANGELEFDKWMRANKLPQHFRQKRRHKILRRAEAKPAAHAPPVRSPS
jgi:hypothetical protein